MSKAIYYEIPAKKPARMNKFYSQVFDWKLESWGKKYWSISAPKKEKGIDGGLYLSEKMKTVMVTISVPDIDKYIRRIKDNGGKIIVEPEEEIWGWHGYFKDPEGNVMGIMGPKKR